MLNDINEMDYIVTEQLESEQLASKHKRLNFQSININHLLTKIASIYANQRKINLNIPNIIYLFMNPKFS